MAHALRKRTLFLSLDAFGTIFRPSKPVHVQYGEIGAKYGFQDLSTSDIEKSFKAAFREASKSYPNYGKDAGLDARQWWSLIIKNTFAQHTQNPIPTPMIEELLHRFSSKEGYKIFPDAQRLFLALHVVKKSIPENANWPWGRTIVHVTSNSDDRIVGVLESLGLAIGTGTDIEDVSLSYDVGAEKPDARMFAHAARNAPEDAVKVHVGDDLDRDAVAAAEAGDGWHGIFLDRGRRFEEWNADQEHHGLIKLERGGRRITVLDSLDALREWRPDPQ